MTDQLEAMSRTLCLARDLVLSGEPTDEELLSAFTQTTVALVADEENLQSAAAQSAFVTLFLLIARLGCAVRLVMPRVPMIDSQPPARGDELQEALLELGRDLIPGSAATLDKAPADLTFLLGSTPWEEAGRAWRLGANEWAGWTAPAGERVAPIGGTFPLGAMAAATLAAAEPFKAAIRRLAVLNNYPVHSEFTQLVPRAYFALAPLGTPVVPINIGDIDSISGGAITNAVLYSLLRIPRLSGAIRVIEPERLDLSNNNRYMLARASEAGLYKINILASYSTPAISIRGVQAKFTEEADRKLNPLAPRAIIGADDIPARWHAQHFYREWLGVGATSHFTTITSEHTLDQACAGCLHPHDDPGPAIIPTAPFISFWAGLLLATRLVRYAMGYPHPPSEQAVIFCPLLPDQPHARLSHLVPVRKDCPVSCPATLVLRS